jgi:tape measure domain-containing protein
VQAQEITKSVINYTAAMGLGSEVTERIILNFGQMRNQGKLTSTELRDLARGAFLPLNDVLREAAELMGVSADKFQEFRQEAAKGKVPIDVFFKAFINFVEREMPEAAERMGKTFNGVVIRLRNFAKVVLGGDILGPTFRQIAGSISKFLDSLLSPEVRTNARIIGETLRVSFSIVSNILSDVLIPAIRSFFAALGIGLPNARSFAEAIAFIGIAAGRLIANLAQVINAIRERFSTGLGSLIQNMFQFGFNIIASLSRGMAAAVRLVLNVIRAIAYLLTVWF